MKLSVIAESVIEDYLSESSETQAILILQSKKEKGKSETFPVLILTHETSATNVLEVLLSRVRKESMMKSEKIKQMEIRISKFDMMCSFSWRRVSAT